MNKQEFLWALRGALGDLSEADVQPSLDYYAEIIDDQVEEGIPEADAVASLGPVSQVAETILLDMPLPKLVSARVKPKRRLRAWEITLIAVGFPLWFPLMVAAAVVVLALYAVLWALVVCVYATGIGVSACCPAGVALGIALFVMGSPAAALVWLGGGLVCGGLGILLFFGCKGATKGAWRLSKWMVLAIKRCFVKKGAVS